MAYGLVNKLEGGTNILELTELATITVSCNGMLTGEQC